MVCHLSLADLSPKKKKKLSVADYMIRIRSAWLLAQLRVMSRVCQSGVDYVYLSYL
jgi:hypothetical protein